MTNDVGYSKSPNVSANNSTAAIELRSLTKRFGDVTAVDDVTLTVERGEMFGFLGPNGAGKSTTLRLLLGLVHPSAGAAFVMGQAAGSTAAKKHLAYVPGDVAMWDKFTGAECLTYFERLHGAIDVSYRNELIERFDLDVNKRFRAYSKGNRQKVALVAALATRADVLLFDEPTSGLDPIMERVFQDCVREAANRGQTLFLSSHILSEVDRICSRIGIIRQGRLVQTATIEDLRSSAATDMVIDFEGPAPVLDLVDNAVVTESMPGRLRVRVHGSPNAVLAVLAASNVTSLESREASLEDIFMSFYGEDASEPDPS